MTYINPGFEPKEIAKLKEQCAKNKRSFVFVDAEDNTEDYMHFQFPGKYEGKEVVYDAVIYTLRLHHTSELYDLAEDMARKQFPKYNRFDITEEDKSTPEDEEVGLFLAETIMELEDEETIKVQEHVDQDLDCDFGVSLDIGLNVEEITTETIEKFIQEFNAGTLKLDPTLYSFQTDDSEEE
jgi:hypothetical protein